MIERKPSSPLALHVTPLGRRVADVMDAAGLGVNVTQDQWRQVQDNVASIIAGEA